MRGQAVDLSRATFIVAGSKPWNRSIFEQTLLTTPGRWVYIDTPAELTAGRLEEFRPRYIFFLHWSWRVPAAVYTRYECVCFHMTDVPFGRGGSPLQNLIVRGHNHTKISALRMVEELDAGPVYMKRDLCLRGSAEEVYMRATQTSASMILDIVREQPEPVPQEGEPVIFRRRTPLESELPNQGGLEQVHDFIRMLDADGYPRAHLTYGPFRLEFSRAVLYDGQVSADVKITLSPTQPE